MTLGERTLIPLEDIPESMNAALRGWVNYFHYRNSGRIFGKVKAHAEERLRTQVMKRHKVKDRGTGLGQFGLGQFPSQKLYTFYGLYKVPTTADWKTAQVLAWGTSKAACRKTACAA
ncbi:MAG TPA: group II intron maturase-specific domain-containing protein [Nitrosospira sp.]|nr:group II intron maturase-specific domain-containing protein [Nitrosospira sp.]